MKVCDKTCIFCFFPIVNKYLCMAKRSLLSRCPSYITETNVVLVVTDVPSRSTGTSTCKNFGKEARIMAIQESRNRNFFQNLRSVGPTLVTLSSLVNLLPPSSG